MRPTPGSTLHFDTVISTNIGTRWVPFAALRKHLIY
jgi:hypothetical protein